MREEQINVSSEEYGPEFAGVYKVRALTWKHAREILRRAVKAKDEALYLEELIIASVNFPGELSNNTQLDNLPAGLVRRLMDTTLKLNDVSKSETAFLSNSATQAVASSPRK